MNSSWATSRFTEVGRALTEIVIAGIAAVMITLEVWVFDPGGWTAARTVAGLTAALSLVFLRSAPFPAYLANGIGLYALTSLGFPSDYYQWTNLVALIAVASRVNLAKSVICLVLSYTGIAFYFFRFPDEGSLTLAGAVMAIWTAAWFAGRTQLARTRETEAKQQSELARAELAAQRSQADLEAERGRIAHELHDVVGHAVNVIVVHAGAGQAVTMPGEKVRDIFATIGATGRAALADLDRMLDVLHGDVERTPLPGLAQVEDLCSSVRSTGLEVDVTVADEARTVSTSVGLATHRIVQEALTNVIKHAHATAVRVDIGVVSSDPESDPESTERQVSIIVRDNGSGGSATPGRGLSGIAARATLHGGSLRYGPADEGGFELSVRLAAEVSA